MKKRMFGIDFIKILAGLLVITHHHLSAIGFYGMQFGKSNTLYFLSAIQSITLTCVPLFIITSGYLLSSQKLEFKNYKKILFFIMEVILIYTIGSLVYNVLYSKIDLYVAFKECVKLILAPNNYVNLYITLFIFSPFYNKLYFSLQDQQKKILLIILLSFISLIRLQNLIPHFIYFSGWPSASYPTLYYFIGMGIKDFRPNISKIRISLFMFAVVIFYSIFMRYYMSGRTFYYLLGHYEGIFTVVISTCIFLLFYDIDISNGIIKRIVEIGSSLSLSFYLLGGNFTDKIAMTFINVTGIPSIDILTFPKKVILSTLFIIPVALIIKAIQERIVSPIITKLIYK